MGVAPVIATVTVPNSAGRVRVTTSNIYVVSIYFEAQATANNTGSIYIGGANVSSTFYMAALTPGQGFNMSIDGQAVRPSGPNGGPEINISQLYIAATTNNNKVQVSYLERVGSV